MANDSRKDNRVKIVSLSVRYKSATVDEFVDNHAHDISSGGMFVKTQKAFAPGTLLKFEVRIAGDVAVISGIGRVAWKRDAEGAAAAEPPGMGVKFIKLDDDSKAVVARLTSAKNASDANAQALPITAPSVGPGAFDDDGDDDFSKQETVVRQTRELLEQALQEAGGSLEELMNLPGVIASSADPPMPDSSEEAQPVVVAPAPAPAPAKVAVSVSPPSTKRTLREAAARPDGADSKVPWFPIFVGVVVVGVTMFAFRDELFGPSSPQPGPPAPPAASPAPPVSAPVAAPALSVSAPAPSAQPSAQPSAAPLAEPSAIPSPSAAPAAVTRDASVVDPTPPPPKPKPKPRPKQTGITAPPADPGDNPY